MPEGSRAADCEQYWTVDLVGEAQSGVRFHLMAVPSDLPPDEQPGQLVAAATDQPTMPSATVREELELTLQENETLLGEVWRRRRAGESAEEIQAARGAVGPTFVWNYERILRVYYPGTD